MLRVSFGTFFDVPISNFLSVKNRVGVLDPTALATTF